MTSDLLPDQSHLFDIPDGICYLNAATMGPLPNLAVAAGQAGLARKAHPWTIASADFFTDTDRLRPKLARLIHADTPGIAFCASASYGLATAAQVLEIGAGKHVLTLADQFPSNVYTWRTASAATGGTVKTVGSGNHNASLSNQLLDAIGPDTAIVACPQVRWTDGARIDLVAIGARAREVGAALVVDLSQSCGAMVFDVNAVQPDFVVCVGYKWLLGPYGLGFLYAAPHRRDGIPLEQNWIARQGSTDFTRLTDYQDAYGPGAERYDMGERSNFALLPALEASVDLILDWRVERIEATLAANNRYLCDKLNQIGLATPPEAERGPHYVGAQLPADTPGDLTKRLAADHVYVSQRATSLRITPHLYNTRRDVDRLIEALSEELSPRISAA